MNLAERAAATDVVVKRFRNRAHDWKGGMTCLHLARAQLRAMGHRPERIPNILSAKGAAMALKRRGHDDLVALIDTLGLGRIAATRLWVGDLVMLPGDPATDAGLGMGSLTVFIGGSMVFGWHGSDMTRPQSIDVTAQECAACWRL